ncbi:uncharacterized protein B0T15DRAFT_523110 [Chaetomium strumarium]|uniref:Uncharacterized protein n=1 Tax=Chaetomium strumarium TaxID=1170767 RepID=A0AAJ0M3S9_9PEZI|nr:hypothetical protein B0T15DRAFT_523110 [Chaetomium strumarium]
METGDGFDPNLLLSLTLSDSEPEEAAAPSTTAATKTTTEHQPTRAERTALSEETFQRLKQTYRPKIENGNIYKTIQLPTSPSPSSSSSSGAQLSKPEAQALLHATEELYFFRRYAEAAAFLQEVFAATDVVAAAEGEDKAEQRLIDGETAWLLQDYQRRCLARLSSDEETRKQNTQQRGQKGLSEFVS